MWWSSMKSITIWLDHVCIKRKIVKLPNQHVKHRANWKQLMAETRLEPARENANRAFGKHTSKNQSERMVLLDPNYINLNRRGAINLAFHLETFNNADPSYITNIQKRNRKNLQISSTRTSKTQNNVLWNLKRLAWRWLSHHKVYSQCKKAHIQNWSSSPLTSITWMPRRGLAAFLSSGQDYSFSLS